MAKRHVTDDELKLLQAILAAGLANEHQLAAVLGQTPEQVSNRIRVLIELTPLATQGLVMARMTRHSGSTVEHASDVKLTPAGRRAAESGLTVVDC